MGGHYNDTGAPPYIDAIDAGRFGPSQPILIGVSPLGAVPLAVTDRKLCWQMESLFVSKFGQNHGGKIKDLTWRVEHHRVDIVVSVLLVKYLQKKDRIGFHSVWPEMCSEITTHLWSG